MNVLLKSYHFLIVYISFSLNFSKICCVISVLLLFVAVLALTMRSYYVVWSLLLVSLVILCSEKTNARYGCYCGLFCPVKDERCRYKGYTPRGGIPDIKPIPTPVAKGFKSSLAFIAGVISHTAGVGRATTTALAAAAASIEKVYFRLTTYFLIFFLTL